MVETPLGTGDDVSLLSATDATRRGELGPALRMILILEGLRGWRLEVEVEVGLGRVEVACWLESVVVAEVLDAVGELLSVAAVLGVVVGGWLGWAECGVAVDVELVAEPVAFEVACELVPPLALLRGALSGALADHVAQVRGGLFDCVVGLGLDFALMPDSELALGSERDGGLLAVAREPLVGVASLVAELLLAFAGVGELPGGVRGGLLLGVCFGE